MDGYYYIDLINTETHFQEREIKTLRRSTHLNTVRLPFKDILLDQFMRLTCAIHRDSFIWQTFIECLKLQFFLILIKEENLPQLQCDPFLYSVCRELQSNSAHACLV